MSVVEASPIDAGGTEAPVAPGRVDRRRFRELFTAVLVPMFLAAADQTLLATATPVITRELGDLDQSAWLAVAYLIAALIVVPLYGRWGDEVGRRRALVRAVTLFGLGSLACALAPGFWWLVAARVLQGLGGGGLMTLSQALIGEVVSPAQRARNQGWFAIIFTLASVLGPVVGGVVVEHASWRWLFIVNVPLCAYAAWRLHRLQGQDVPHPAPGRQDTLGLACFALALVCTLWALSPGIADASHAGAARVALIAAAAVSWAALIVVERRHPRPFLPIDLLRVPAIRYAVLTVIVFASVMFAMIFYLPVYLQLALGHGASRSGLQLLPLTAGIVGGAALSGRFIVHTGRPTMLPLIGLPLAAVCLCALGALAPSEWRVAGLGFGAGLGLGCVMSVMQIVTQTAAGPERLGSASAAVSLARSLGSSLGASVFGAVVYGSTDTELLRQALQTPAAQAGLQQAFHIAFLCAAALCLLATAAASAVPSLRLPVGR